MASISNIIATAMAVLLACLLFHHQEILSAAEAQSGAETMSFGLIGDQAMSKLPGRLFHQLEEHAKKQDLQMIEVNEWRRQMEKQVLESQGSKLGMNLEAKIDHQAKQFASLSNQLSSLLQIWQKDENKGALHSEKSPLLPSLSGVSKINLEEESPTPWRAKGAEEDEDLGDLNWIMGESEENALMEVDRTAPLNAITQLEVCFAMNDEDRRIIVVIGYIGKVSIKILVDTGAAKSFLSSKLGMKLGFMVRKVKPFMVIVVDSHRITNDQICHGAQRSVQQHNFKFDLKFMELGHWDLILGTDWMTYFSPILFDYESF
ncbi:OLC1v1004654C1 [Oldenlandia corymbosa var. corymbosa]|uniref:OLC1v1004654C1 n=1 Tax=Oldenlandia corymbosa var. corymbosa TaxID=529605 RepID=A0AAV1DE45_OLDCO|nr:OLC1v1004654C1 [Oldenlandia corymbosa var. corymbosa]